MSHSISRRDFTKLAGFGGVAFASGLFANEAARAASGTDFHFVQLSDSHWGFSGDPLNPEAKTTLPRAVAAVNALAAPPDFVIFTGDLTHTTEDVAERKKRMTEFRQIVKDLKVKDVYFIPGEHDASLDKGAAYKEFFGETHFAFKHKGINFVALDNVSDPKAFIGDEQLKWLDGELAKIKKNEPIVVFAHRPLFDLYPQWDWATADGTEVTNRLAKFDHVVVFYGHIHQENHQTIGNITHHAATSLIFPLIAPGSGPKRMPIAWDKDAPFKGLGWRNVDADPKSAEYQLVQNPVKA